ncbi:MAG TPA: TnsA endonuclease N-terminal domain-containing protein [Ktedonobacterales bacterium]|nr:TnsA endonuclease N-terminal domain-containing protein [Ktedonobacterales bacterium]
MAKRDRSTNQNVVRKRMKEDRGKGRGAEYHPWLHIQDVPSEGLVSRIKGWKNGRVYHLMSKLERRYFYILEWSSQVIDVREQFPLLPLEETLAIAKGCGFQHPTDPQTKQPVVMTTDFVITLSSPSGSVDQARAIKPSSKLQSERTLEKLEIERRYWAVRKVDWGIVTEREIPAVIADNVELLHSYLFVSDRFALTDAEVAAITSLLTREVSQGQRPLRHIATDCDKALGFEPGTSLAFAYHLLASRQWIIDMNSPLNPGKKLSLLTTNVAAEEDQETGGIA